MMPTLRGILKPAAWGLYFAIVFEILFLISPLARYYTSFYGPFLNLWHRWPATSWLTQFFLPHFSQTPSPLLNGLRRLSWPLVVGGMAFFLSAAIPLYWSKLRRHGPVHRGLYASIRHPQYIALAVAGLGTLLVWPRFLVLVSYVTMICLCRTLARWEEGHCLDRFGASYQAYRERSGMFLPRRVSERLPRLLPATGKRRALAEAVVTAVAVVASTWIGFQLRDYSLRQVSASFREDVAVLSPAALSAADLDAVYGTARDDPRVRQALRDADAVKQIVYILPEEWQFPDVPIEASRRRGGHRHRLKVLFTRAMSHAPEARGSEIVERAYGRDPVLMARVDTSVGRITALENPPSRLFGNGLPTPMF